MLLGALKLLRSTQKNKLRGKQEMQRTHGCREKGREREAEREKGESEREREPRTRPPAHTRPRTICPHSASRPLHAPFLCQGTADVCPQATQTLSLLTTFAPPSGSSALPGPLLGLLPSNATANVFRRTVLCGRRHGIL